MSVHDKMTDCFTDECRAQFWKCRLCCTCLKNLLLAPRGQPLMTTISTSGWLCHRPHSLFP